jgi:hypothetical protein
MPGQLGSRAKPEHMLRRCVGQAGYACALGLRVRLAVRFSRNETSSALIAHVN